MSVEVFHPLYDLLFRWAPSSILIAAFFLVGAGAGCGPDRSAIECLVDEQCGNGFVCVAGSCEIVRPNVTPRPVSMGGPEVDSGRTNASQPDAGSPDAGRPDAGGLVGPSGSFDAGRAPDMGQPDAGQPDAGQPDAGHGGCVPRACPSGAECGTIDDGCGGTLYCGTCPGSAICRDHRCACLGRETWTTWHRFRTAQSIGANDAADWVGLGDGVQRNKQGTNVLLSAQRPRSDILYLRDAGLSIPDDAEVLGIEISLDMKRNGARPYLDFLYLWQSNLRSVPRRSVYLALLDAGYRNYSWGGASDRWGIDASALHPSRVNGSTFGVRLVFQASVVDPHRSEPYVDVGHVRVRYRASCN